MKHALILIAFLFVLPPVSGQGELELLPSDGASSGSFGHAVAISGGTAIAGGAGRVRQPCRLLVPVHEAAQGEAAKSCLEGPGLALTMPLG